MAKQAIKITFTQGENEITIETGKLATQANGSVVVKQGGTMLLATVVSNKEANADVDFLPLSVDYRENYSATGKFPGGFFKREARPSEYEILISRLVDRALRPLFPSDYHAETQVIISLISAEENVMPDALAALAASAAISVSDIPFDGPISEVRVARLNGEFIINPTMSEMEECDMELMVAASMDNIMMVEGEMHEVSEKEMLDAMIFAHEAIKEQVKAQKQLAELVEKSKIKREYSHEENDEELRERMFAELYDEIYAVAMKALSKHERSEAFSAIKEKFLSTFSEEEQQEKKTLVGRYFHDVEKKAVRDMVLNENIRLDGRRLDEIRPIWTEVDYLPGTHGSAIFTRGETQSLTSVTLGTKLDEQLIDGAVLSGTNRFLLHYNFPPFSTGEARFLRGTSRREIGHGNLAMRALKIVLPGKDEMPYTLRIVSNILESNGSSSMATVCAGTMALMDAGVKIRKPVSGIAMGLITDKETGKYAILSDILGDEDHLGDMDFKVTGTEDGITACQMDIKVDGLPYNVLEEALEQARKGRLHILGEMMKTIDTVRDDYKENVPRIVSFTIPKDDIGAVIGSGGKVIQEIQKETNTTIIIEEEGEFGRIEIVAINKDDYQKARTWIEGIIEKPELNKVYEGVVKKIAAFGAFVEILPGTDGLLHISEVDWKRIEDLDKVMKEGDRVKVKLIEIDKKTGKLRLSRKVLIPRPERKK
jgi:polyribonucleotide nucleotidyltransferase